MPFYKYKCADCGSVGEAFERTRYNSETKETYMERAQYCGQEDLWNDFKTGEQLKGCGSQNINRQLPTSFAISGESTGSGCDARGYFSASLGKYVTSRKEERKIMEDAGFVAMSDLGGDKWFEEASYNQRVKLEKQQAKTDQYQAALQSGKSKEEAVAETFTAKEAISGDLDKLYDTAIKH